MPTTEIDIMVLTLGCLFMTGMVADIAGRYTALPRVTLLLITGFLIGPSMIGWLPDAAHQWFPLITNLALSMVGFLLGGSLHRDNLKTIGRDVFGVSLGVILVTVVLLPIVLIPLGVSPVLALLLGGIATATAPAATMDVVKEARAKGPFTKTLLGVVAIDDAWGLLVFSLLLAAAQMLAGQADAVQAVITGTTEICYAFILGVLIGVPVALLSGRIRPGEPTQAEAIGAVLIASGLAANIGASSLLTTIVMGAVVANLAQHHERQFHAIEGIEWPFLILFFLLAGASLNLASLQDVGLLTTAYIALRVVARIIGANLGGIIVGTPLHTRRWIGIALLPQAGVAVGMTLIATQRFPELRDVLLPVALSATVMFELVGPVLTRWSLKHCGEIAMDQCLED